MRFTCQAPPRIAAIVARTAGAAPAGVIAFGRVPGTTRSHHVRSGEELETTLNRNVWLHNQQTPQSALGSKPPLQAMKDWHKLKPELFRKQPYYLPGCDT